jgi:hypothetical protein
MKPALAAIVLGLAIGCSTNGHGESSAPILGTWVLNSARTSPAAATDPAVAASVAATMTFSRDGTYHGSATFNGHTNEDSGTWRIVGSEIYIKPEGGGREGHLELRGNDLIVYALYEPGALIYERKR